MSPSPAGCASARSWPPGRRSARPRCSWRVERGLENVLVEDIAAAAGVSPRTFNNYFASKYEAICALALDRACADRRGAARPARGREPVGGDLPAPCWPSTRWPATAPDPRLHRRHPAGHQLAGAARGVPEGAGRHAVRAGRRPSPSGPAADPAADTFLPGRWPGAVTAAMQAATERWLFADPPVRAGAGHRGRRCASWPRGCARSCPALPAGPRAAAAAPPVRPPENSEPAMTAPASVASRTARRNRRARAPGRRQPSAATPRAVQIAARRPAASAQLRKTPC